MKATNSIMWYDSANNTQNDHTFVIVDFDDTTDVVADEVVYDDEDVADEVAAVVYDDDFGGDEDAADAAIEDAASIIDALEADTLIGDEDLVELFSHFDDTTSYQPVQVSDQGTEIDDDFLLTPTYIHETVALEEADERVVQSIRRFNEAQTCMF